MGNWFQFGNEVNENKNDELTNSVMETFFKEHKHTINNFQNENRVLRIREIDTHSLSEEDEEIGFTNFEIKEKIESLKFKKNKFKKKFHKDIKSFKTDFEIESLEITSIPNEIKPYLQYRKTMSIYSHSFLPSNKPINLFHFSSLVYQLSFQEDFFLVEFHDSSSNNFLSYFYFNSKLNFGVFLQLSYGKKEEFNNEKTKIRQGKYFIDNVKIIQKLEKGIKEYRLEPGTVHCKHRLVIIMSNNTSDYFFDWVYKDSSEKIKIFRTKLITLEYKNSLCLALYELEKELEKATEERNKKLKEDKEKLKQSVLKNEIENDYEIV